MRNIDIPHYWLVQLSFQHSGLLDVTQGMLLIYYCVMFTKQLWQRELENVI